jgi:hypothetical protein
MGTARRGQLRMLEVAAVVALGGFVSATAALFWKS